jgi:ABC-type phosphate transport system substrate-binding protein
LRAEKARPPAGSRPGRSALAVTALVCAAALTLTLGLPGSSIVLVHRSDSSGSTFLFTSYLNAQDPADWNSSLIGTKVAWPQQPGEMGASGSSMMISAVHAAPGSIGYVGVSYLTQVTLAQDLRAFLTWAINLGTAQLAKVNFQPLPQSTAVLSQAQIAEIRG